MAQASLSQDLASGDEVTIAVSGNVSRKNAADPVYLNVSDAAGRFAAVETMSVSAGSFSFNLTTRSTLEAGNVIGTVEVRACKDVQCSQPYAGATMNIPYTLRVGAVDEWTMHQRDAVHSGYVPVVLNPAKFAKAWEWSHLASDPIGGINPVVTSAGKVMVTADVYFGNGVVYALSEADGKQLWERSLGRVPAMGPPAVSNGKVFVPVTGHQDTFLWTIDAADGNIMFKSAFESQWPHVLAPTVMGDQVVVGAGYYGGETYSFNAATGARNWVHSAGGVWDMYSPAADAKYYYHHNGQSLFIINRSTGVTEAEIEDLLGKRDGYSYHGGPLLGARNNAISYAGGAYSGRASSNAEQYDQRVLSSFDLAARKYQWSTGSAYLTVPALANGVLYAGRNAPASLDAIDEATGKVLWSWTPPGDGETFHRNIIATRNLLLFSTDQKVYALDLASKKVVWTYPQPGMLALSANRTLYIATGARESDGKLVAVRLK